MVKCNNCLGHCNKIGYPSVKKGSLYCDIELGNYYGFFPTFKRYINKYLLRWFKPILNAIKR